MREEKPIFADKGVIAMMTEECKRRSDAGASTEEVIQYIHDKEFSILDCMKIVKRVYGITLDDAKMLVTSHPAWAMETGHIRSLGEALADGFEKESQIP